MDSLISSALEEICSQGQTGLLISSLWPKLENSLSLSLSPSHRASLHSNLLKIPSLQFRSPQNAAIDASDASIQRVDDAERLGLRIIASSQLGDSFVGLYDMSSGTSGLSAPQRRVLERLALARENGITQTQLAKEFGIEGRNFFYIVKNLECKGLIMRQPAVVRTKETSGVEGESKSSSCISTNLMYLHRYAKHLSAQQKLEISKEGPTVESFGKEYESENTTSRDSFPRESFTQDVHVKDYLPAMEAICKKLEEANEKVLVVTDLKQDLGYCGSTLRHRSWRNIRQRLKDSGTVEEFDAVVNEKVERCIRLLKKFSLKEFERNSLGCGDNTEKEQQMKFGRRSPKNEQLVELPIEHQIYDMVDAEGSEGLTVIEVCDRLGIENKKNYSRLCNMFTRFGMHLQAENHKRTVAFRVWTSGNSNLKSSNPFISNSKIVDGENEISYLDSGNPDDVPHKPAQRYGHSTSEGDFATLGEKKDTEINIEIPHGSFGNGRTNHMLPCPGNLQESIREPSGTDLKDGQVDVINTPILNSTSNSSTTNGELEGISVPVQEEIDLESTATETNTSRSEKGHHALSKTHTNPFPLLTADGLRREQRILQRLQDDKFILRSELQKWLVSLEDKGTTMDRKTILRILTNLQQQGHCKFLSINVPVLSNCGRSRITQVVFHPSIQVQALTPDLLSEIHDRVRSFEMQIRGRGSSRWKKNDLVPVLDGVQRTQSRVAVESDDKAFRLETIRANGFVIAKMIRAKLLHKFLWSYLSSSPGSDDALSPGEHVHDFIDTHNSCKLFSLETAIKNIPLELFSQVAGSTHKSDSTIEKCKGGLCLSDLPLQEYKRLMDTQATGRLSVIIDILRRLKLIRLVANGHSNDGINIPHANLTHAMELKPYIEEPPSVSTTSNFTSLDLRPRIRHDFILSSEEAVDEYWQTLEYCYAVADRIAALHAFPGSAVHEVFVYRSWASVMTADQRAELQSRIAKDNHEKLPFKECEKIAKDLNLTLEQVLRMYYDKKNQRLNRFRGAFSVDGEERQLLENKLSPSPQKRRKALEERSVKRTRVDAVIGQLVGQRIATSPITEKTFIKELNPCILNSGEDDFHLPGCPEDDHLETVEETGPNEEDDEYNSLLGQSTFSNVKRSRQKRFLWTDEAKRSRRKRSLWTDEAERSRRKRSLWTDEADRQLVIEYVRHRAALGPKFHRVDWSSLSNLPAFPWACAKRISLLNRNTKFRKALMKLCNILGERYVKHLEKTQSNDDCRPLENASPGKVITRRMLAHTEDAGFEENRWDDFDDINIKRVLEGVLQLKRLAKLEASTRVGSVSRNHNKSGLDSPTTCNDENIGMGQHKDAAQRTRYHHQKVIKHLNEGISISRQVSESLAVSNAIELFKLIFLSTSKAPEVQMLLAQNIRCYSEHDLLTAFSYLREKKFMNGDNGAPFVLSQLFLQSISKSPFPIDTGKRAAKLSSQLYERKNDLIEQGINLDADLQCGDILHLFYQVSSGELSISPCLPDEGVGEAEDFRSLKRKNEDNDLCDNDKAKKLKFLSEGELISRREKGFPGIMVSVHGATILTADAVEMFKDGETCTAELHGNAELNSTMVERNGGGSCQPDCMKEVLDVASVVPIAGSSSESPWDAMSTYAEYLLSPDQKEVSFVSPQVFKTVYAAIQKSGDQGLSIAEVSHVVDMPGEKIPECIIDVLQAFGQALKVNAFDSVRVVDALYRSKFFLTSMDGFCQDLNKSLLTKVLGDLHPPENHDISGANSQNKMKRKASDVHQVTILNLPEEVAKLLNEPSTSNVHKDSTKGGVALPGGNNKDESYKFSSSDLYMPILPWINGDGTINNIVYNGLLRRLLGIVMQNPGILEDDIIHQMDVLNPQSCKKLMELMVLDGHLIVRRMRQTTYNRPPTILQSLIGNRCKKSKMVYRDHFFANPKSTSLL
ncbi:hypothetical protein LWI28_025385 [Acer negundo]|uniref:B-block binding subunit of TFIIIC domain-containing protein n=1 Tax=Acer negundo TaxID=4023 RepID=A0AAD5NKG3_ACENE|nr:hypothetical protein LWI28_025385 [Acer negundo]KAK4839769.1 hypothetical protein QYF36_024841 [Acer negundo]